MQPFYCVQSEEVPIRNEWRLSPKRIGHTFVYVEFGIFNAFQNHEESIVAQSGKVLSYSSVTLHKSEVRHRVEQIVALGWMHSGR
jgi:hypothetical protein